MLFSIPEPSYSQKASWKVKFEELKKERKERSERRQYEKERKKFIQDHINRQSPEVQERMKQNRRDSRRMNRRSREPFYRRWFRKKRG
ncbi:MAG: hypothetical protein R6U58_09685 [Bacteroidales bacterium]